MRTALVLTLTLFTIAGCGAGGSPCELAVRDAAAMSNADDSVGRLDEAITKCGTLEEFTSAVDQHPNALEGVDAKTLVVDRCAHEPSVASSSLCGEVVP